MESIYYVLNRACHRRCKHCYEGRFRPYVRDALREVVEDSKATFPNVLDSLPDELSYLDAPSGTAPGVNRHRPMRDLRCINADAYSHPLPSLQVSRSMPRLAGIALQSHRGHRVISGRSEAAMRAAKPPKPSRTAGMTAIPAPPAPRQYLTSRSAMKRGKAA